MVGRILVIIAIIFSASTLHAQVDTDFWFAPPEVSQGHGDRPIFLRISTLDEAASVKIYLPGRQANPIFTKNVNANSTVNVDLSGFANLIETTPANEVLKTGLRVVSTAPITAYYEVSSTWNVDIFVLKGKNALGNNFIIPAQNQYDNGSYSPTPHFSFDIVATRNNTVVYITPTSAITGHPSGEKFLIKLNQGETYSARRVSSSAAFHLAGSEVVSNKPIAITLKDDSVIDSGCRDLLGDQLVPVKVAGNEYVVLKGFLDNGEWGFITGIEDNTKIYISGSSTPSATINKGQLFKFRLTANSTHILGDKPILLIHVTGFGCEAGMALLPSVNCRGSTQIGFTRSTSEFFGLNILVRKEGIGNFMLNGNTSSISGTSFDPVAGTDETWYAAQLSFQNNNSGVPVGLASLISNSSHSFQIGVVNGGAGSSCRYGYFSSFATLFIGDDIALCPLETALLDAGPSKDDYLWSDGSTGQYFEVSQPGKYWVNTTKENCILSDTVTVEIKAATLDLGPDQTFCVGDTISIDGKENFSWLWSDGSAEQFLKTTEPGTYSLEISNFTGCVDTDEITVTHRETPTVELGEPIEKCPTDEIVLDASYPAATYTWNTGSTSSTLAVIDSGEYFVQVAFQGCFARDTIHVNNLPGPTQDVIYGSPSVCPFVTEVDYWVDTASGDTYVWAVNGGIISENNQDSIRVNWEDTNSSASVALIITNEIGCESEPMVFAVKINEILDVVTPIGQDSVCLNLKDGNQYSVGYTNGSVYDWQVTGGNIISGAGQSQVIIDWNSTGPTSLSVNERSTTIADVCDGTSEVLEVHVFKDTTSLLMDYVSVENKAVFIKWKTNDPSRVLGGNVFLERWPLDELFSDWTIPISASDNSFFDIDVSTNTRAYEYQLMLTNLCFEPLETSIHTSILLSADKDSTNGILHLNWNEYRGWSSMVDTYQIYRKLDSGDEVMVQELDPSTTEFELDATDGFTHQLRIRAISTSGQESWSNEVSTKFEHPIHLIPNVITPNGDPYNEFFFISKIWLYPNSHLYIVDRWGRSVYDKKGYDNSWKGDDLSTGVFYYLLDIPERNEQYKGSITILR